MQEDLDALVAAVEAARESVVAASAAVTHEQGSFKPPGAWSITEVIEHLYLAELSGIAKMWEASTALRAGTRWDGELPNRGKRIEQVVQETWKPKELAPSIATPQGEGPLRFWLTAFRSLQNVLAALAAQLEGLALDAVIFPHYLSGPLDARQRLEFLRYHMERHLSQIQRIKESSGFPR